METDPHKWSLTSEQRIGDADRDKTVTYLGQMLAGGYLDHDEFVVRMESALKARTWGQIAGVVQHLPSASAPRPKIKLRARIRRLNWNSYRVRIPVHGFALLFSWAALLPGIVTNGFATSAGALGVTLGVTGVITVTIGTLLSLVTFAFWAVNH